MHLIGCTCTSHILQRLQGGGEGAFKSQKVHHWGVPFANSHVAPKRIAESKIHRLQYTQLLRRQVINAVKGSAVL